MAFETSSARARLSSRLTRARPARYKRLRRTTTAPTIDVTPSTCLPLMPRRMTIRWLLCLLRPKSQFIQLIVQRLEADAENFCGPRLVVPRVLQRHHDQAPFGFLDCRPRSERNLRLADRSGLRGEHRRQVRGFDKRTRSENRR